MVLIPLHFNVTRRNTLREQFCAEMDPLKLLPGASSQDDQLAEHMAECLGEGVRALAFQLPILSFSILIAHGVHLDKLQKGDSLCKKH